MATPHKPTPGEFLRSAKAAKSDKSAKAAKSERRNPDKPLVRKVKQPQKYWRKSDEER